MSGRAGLRVWAGSECHGRRQSRVLLGETLARSIPHCSSPGSTLATHTEWARLTDSTPTGEHVTLLTACPLVESLPLLLVTCAGSPTLPRGWLWANTLSPPMGNEVAPPLRRLLRSEEGTGEPGVADATRQDTWPAGPLCWGHGRASFLPHYSELSGLGSGRSLEPLHCAPTELAELRPGGYPQPRTGSRATWEGQCWAAAGLTRPTLSLTGLLPRSGWHSLSVGRVPWARACSACRLAAAEALGTLECRYPGSTLHQPGLGLLAPSLWLGGTGPPEEVSPGQAPTHTALSLYVKVTALYPHPPATHTRSLSYLLGPCGKQVAVGVSGPCPQAVTAWPHRLASGRPSPHGHGANMLHGDRKYI